MNDRPRYRVTVLELPEHRDVLEDLLDALPASAELRSLVVGASYAAVTLGPDGVRVFRPADLGDVERLLEVLHAEALPEPLRVDCACSPEAAGRLRAFAEGLPKRVPQTGIQ